MTDKTTTTDTEKSGMHPRNPHRFRYDFEQLIKVCPELAPFVSMNKFNSQSIDFADPQAVKLLNKAILKQYYDIQDWDIPQNYLCPPIPGRADYIHHMADLLATSHKGIIPTGPTVSVLDIGVGANCVYPIIGHKAYGWKFVGSDIDPMAIKTANQIISSNPTLKGAVECRLQSTPSNIFSNIIKKGETFDLAICNPPFHSSSEEAAGGTERKARNLSSEKKSASTLNFGGQNHELWCDGGEAEFVRRMIKQSSELPTRCLWFSSLVSKKSNLYAIYKFLKKVGALQVHTIEMTHGQKQSRIVAWTFLSEEQLTKGKKK
ncbi:MAG TPA: 23S rRNA (adenine(1618)-N(6))-methyltransferase RlmF [Prolixibacteraceae bacterium]|nr:23S rRNA (adenine(1618)-N(6))-methyltransferase RlmF [Prolixibacteraceae bacterium]